MSQGNIKGSEIFGGIMVIAIIGMMFLVFSTPFHPWGVGKETSIGTLVAYEETRGPTGNGPWTYVYLKTDGEDTITIRFMGALDLDIVLGENYKFVYHTEPWDICATLDTYERFG